MPHKSPAEYKAYRKRYYLANKEKFKKWQEKWNVKNSERMKTYRLQWTKADRLANPEKWYRREVSAALRKHYGVTIEWYEEKLRKQKHKCAICQKRETTVDKKNGRIRRLAVDHHHESKKIRGLLCSHCNTALHVMEKSQSWGERALAYLAEYA